MYSLGVLQTSNLMLAFLAGSSADGWNRNKMSALQYVYCMHSFTKKGGCVDLMLLRFQSFWQQVEGWAGVIWFCLSTFLYLEGSLVCVAWPSIGLC